MNDPHECGRNLRDAGGQDGATLDAGLQRVNGAPGASLVPQPQSVDRA